MADAGGDISLALVNSALLQTLTTTGDIQLQAANGQTLSQDATSILAAAGLELLGAGGIFDLLGLFTRWGWVLTEGVGKGLRHGKPVRRANLSSNQSSE